MKWYWAAIIVGLVAPWLIMPKTIIVGFGGGVQTGLGAWAGIATLTVPFMLLAFWLTQLVFG